MANATSCTGFLLTSPFSPFVRLPIKLKPFTENDIDIEITHCGVCNTDCTTLLSAKTYPLCVGHEIIGRAIKVGSKVKGVKYWDRVGVGPIVSSCGLCSVCLSGEENYCEKVIATYDDVYPDGTETTGGFASHVRVHQNFVFLLPSNLDPTNVAPMLCGGLSVFSPMRRHKVSKGTKIGIIGLAGLGHLAILFARALGAEGAYFLSPANSSLFFITACRKRQRCTKGKTFSIFGASVFICTHNIDWSDRWVRRLDIILNTSNIGSLFPEPYLRLLKPHGTYITLGFPENGLPTIASVDLIHSGISIEGSRSGSRRDMVSMLKLAAKAKLKSWVDEVEISEEGCRTAIERVRNGEARYRVVLVGHVKAFNKPPGEDRHLL
ncbi:NADP-dependent alcohol dehydrogenase 7 [Neolecta irregularis DAH-3]|uniref:NADP-dependent alcohol dehydrogenase 7 n=1 Tax=Neolecta irregularis (strain DAH-3) TaxID=1198029 RepID=A0A1U7LMY9_NEOID|nr:NADP-dependent alcohol dehydrogenase 7 [Neolecta irregularis DAH-3]|eukprot:OLL24040.1 NADP-dependent alcohol dehydrogenase 7 [Neolecta irregularis DAH-3]